MPSNVSSIVFSLVPIIFLAIFISIGFRLYYSAKDMKQRVEKLERTVARLNKNKE